MVTGRSGTRLRRGKACLKCYYRKSKCVFSTGNATGCDRCLLNGKECIVVPPLKQIITTAPSNPARMRKPAPGGPATAPETPFPSAALFDGTSNLRPIPTSLISCRSLNPFGGALENLEDIERTTIDRLYHKNNFVLFFVGPSYGDGMHRDMILYLLSRFNEVKESYLAMYSAFASAMNLDDGRYDEALNLRRAAMGVRRMKDGLLPGRCQHEFLPWAGSGLRIIMFSAFALGTSAAPICRLVLGRVRQLSRIASISDIALHPILVYLTTMEINECLLWREFPICGFGEIEPGIVDPYVGITLPVMLFLYELSKLNYNIACKKDIESTLYALDMLHETVEAWDPNPPIDFTERYTTTEVTHMLAQSRAYKYMALLFILCIRHPFDDCDELADTLAKSIRVELRLAWSATREAPRYVAMLFFIASIEARGRDERRVVLEEIEIFIDKFSPKRQRDVAAFLKSLWKTRDTSRGLLWLDLVNHLPPVSVNL